MALNQRTIKVALADQIRRNVKRSITVRPFRKKVVPACITMRLTDITQFETFGPNGQTKIDMDLYVTIHSADPDSEEIEMDDYLSAGTGNLSSIADAINVDPTLGGTVESCKVLEIGAPTDTEDGYEAVIPLQIYTRKAGAQA